MQLAVLAQEEAATREMVAALEILPVPGSFLRVCILLLTVCRGVV